MQSSFIMIGSVWSGPLYDTGHLRTLIFTGCFCLVLGMFLTSICHVYWQFLLAQGFLIGIGLGCLFMPTTGVLAMWFDKRRGLAMGLATSGSALGKTVKVTRFPLRSTLTRSSKVELSTRSSFIAWSPRSALGGRYESSLSSRFYSRSYQLLA